MKRLFIYGIILLGFNSVVLAQTKGKTEVGFNIGYSTYYVSNSNNQHTDSGTAGNFGASIEYYFSDRWGLKGKLIYDPKGWNNGFIIPAFADGYRYVTNYRLHYLSIPVMANWHFGKKRNWYLNFGPYMGFLLNAKETTFNTDLKEAFNSTDFGLALGIGVKIPVSDRLKLSIEYDGQGGFSDVFKTNSTTTSVTNTRGSFNIGLVFPLK